MVVQVRLLGLAVAVAGLLILVSALELSWPAGPWLAEHVFTVGGTQLAGGCAVFVSVLLLIMGRGIAQRRRFALYGTLALLMTVMVADLVRGFDLVSASVVALLAVALLRKRRLFVVPLTSTRILAVLVMLVVVVVVDFGYGLLALASHLSVVGPRSNLGQLIVEIAARLGGITGPLMITGGFGRWFAPSLTALGALTMAIVLLAALAPLRLRGSPSAADRDRARRLVEFGAPDTVGPFVLRRDKRLVFAPDGRAVLAFRCVCGVGLASGDPVGDPSALQGAVREFVRVCERSGWRLAVVGARLDRLPLYQSLGLQTLYIGDEAVIDVSRFRLAGRRMRNVRQAVSRSRNAAITTEICTEAELDAPSRRALLQIARIGRQGRREFGFSMALGDLLTGEYPDCLLVVCRDRAGQAVAFQRYLPCAGDTALSLDVMRRVPDAPNGVNERMVVDIVDWARARGIPQVSLNFAAFRSALDPEVTHDSVQTMLARILRRLDGLFGVQLDTLRRFNTKFTPLWIPRYLIYRRKTDIPAIGLAAFSAEGFLPLDRDRHDLTVNGVDP